MPTEHDFYEAFIEGRWQPEVETKETPNGEWVATYTQGEETLSASSKWNEQQALDNLSEKLRNGILEGKYFPNY